MAARELSTAIKSNELREQRKLIAQQNPSVEAALVGLHDVGATGEEAVAAIYSGLGLSVSDSKSEVIKSTKWEAEVESLEELELKLIEIKFDQ